MSQHGNPPPGATPGQPGRPGQPGQPGRRSQRGRKMSVTDLAADPPESGFDRALQWVPRILSSKLHIVILMLLGAYLIVLPLIGFSVSAKSELIGGNYTNVTSDIGACIAAGGTLHLVNQSRKRQKTEAERLRLTRETHALLHHVHAQAAAELGHLMPPDPADR